MTKLSDLLGGGSGGGVPLAATAFAKPSIILFETRPGTRTWTVPDGVTKIRAFVVGAGGNGGSFGRTGAGGGYSEKVYDVTSGAVINYTVGATPGGTSSFDGPGGAITATGGESNQGAGGTGSGGDVNSSGGDGYEENGGASSGHRFGNGIMASDRGGAGWGEDTGGNEGGSSGGMDGFGLGVVPGARKDQASSAEPADTHGYGCGGASARNGGIGGGGGSGANGGIGGGGGGAGSGGFGLVGVEWLE